MTRISMMAHGLAVGWSAFRQARRKKHGAGPQLITHAFGTALCAHFICYGQKFPRSLSSALARWWMLDRGIAITAGERTDG